MAYATHACKPNELILLEFLYMGPSTSDYKYLLIVKDSLSDFVKLYPSYDLEARLAEESL